MSSLQFSPALSKDQPLVLYELNEVPWRVVDWYVVRRPQSAMARLLKQSRTFTTFTFDEGELHPWTTWPTLHRGVTNREHNIRFINQSRDEAANAHPPLWQTLRQAGKRVGVFGSLQSYPPSSDEGYEFYVPDTFAPGAETWPPKYSAFQRFNLRQTKQDGAQAAQVKLNSNIARDLLEMLQSGLRMRTMGSLVAHLAKERANSLHRSRRSVMQALVAFDFFEDALKHTQPEFCTFFTNHVAGMMHRYWKHAFPEDFGTTLSTPEELFHAKSILFAMDIADAQIATLMAYVSGRHGRLMLASSMGQEAVHRGSYRGEWRITDVPRFLRGIGWTEPAQDLLAMQPDFNFAFPSEAEAVRFMHTTARLADGNGKSIWKRAQRTGTTVNLGLAASEQAVDEGAAWLTRDDGPAARLAISELGIELLHRDPGTGYHQPRGVLMVFGDGISPADSREQIDSTAVRPAILQTLGIEAAGLQAGQPPLAA